MDQKIKEAKEHYLGSGYGRFDLLDQVIPHEILMRKPRIVMRYICRILEIETSRVSYPAFSTWLRRYKNSFDGKKSPTLKEPGLNSSKEEKKEEDIFDFKQTDPFAKPAPEPPLIKIL